MPLDDEFQRGNSRMGERVTPSRRADLAHASRLKKALESGVAPAFVKPGNGASLGMALATAVAMFCYLAAIFSLR